MNESKFGMDEALTRLIDKAEEDRNKIESARASLVEALIGWALLGALVSAICWWLR